jgi:hypothetical protein
MKNLNNTAFSLLEILLSSVIFVIAIGGIFATLNAVRAPVSSKEYGLSSAVFGKQVLEILRKQVNNSSSANFYTDANCSGGICTDFSLAVGAHYVTTSAPTWPSGLSWPTALQSANTVACNVTTALCLQYTVTCADGSASPCTNNFIAHKVVLTIN